MFLSSNEFSLDADIAASLLQEEMHPSPPSVTSKVHSLNDSKARKRTGLRPNSFLRNPAEIVVSDHQGTMDLNTMSIGCLSLLDGLDMQLGTFSHAVVGERKFYTIFNFQFAVFVFFSYAVRCLETFLSTWPPLAGDMPWVGNEAGRMNEMRDSLEDDFYPSQDTVQRAGADSDIGARTTISVSSKLCNYRTAWPLLQ